MTEQTQTPDETATHAAETLAEDPALSSVVERYGPLTLTPADDLFERVVVSLIRQQISMDAAAAIRERLFETVTVTPAGVLAAERETLQEAGLSAAKAEYICNVATAFQANGYDRTHFEAMSDEAVMAELTDIRGVGPWTGKMFLLFGLGRPDVFPVEDLGVRRGMELVFEADIGADGTAEMTRTEMRNRAEEWRPYRSYASLYLWRVYEG